MDVKFLTEDQKQEINKVLESSHSTKRITVDELEKVLYKPFEVLDKGFVRVVDYMGGDSAIVRAARVSYGKGTKKVSDDGALIGYLMRHEHMSPFEMPKICFHIKLPIAVMRQLVRHRTASLNEVSARYSVLPNEFYVPNIEHINLQSTNNKQGRGQRANEDIAKEVLSIIIDDANHNYSNYDKMLEDGVARELARMNLTLGCYTECYWELDLRNLLHFIKLRTHSTAQLEMREYASKISSIVKLWCPHSYEAFLNYNLNSVKVSSNIWNTLKKYIPTDLKYDDFSHNVSKREYEEFLTLFQ